jgi:hypothetical protein
VKGRLRFWNLILIVTVIASFLAFAAHYKNWTKIKPDGIQVLSGFYYAHIKFSDLDSVLLVEKIPPMVRLHGFSALEKEKGIFRAFRDSLTDNKVYVYVDNLQLRKIKLVFHDSLHLYINLADSTETQQMYQFLLNKKKQSYK